MWCMCFGRVPCMPGTTVYAPPLNQDKTQGSNIWRPQPHTKRQLVWRRNPGIALTTDNWIGSQYYLGSPWLEPTTRYHKNPPKIHDMHHQAITPFPRVMVSFINKQSMSYLICSSNWYLQQLPMSTLADNLTTDNCDIWQLWYPTTVISDNCDIWQLSSWQLISDIWNRILET